MIPENEPAFTIIPLCPPNQPIPLEPDEDEMAEAFAPRRAIMAAMGYFDQEQGGARRMRVARTGTAVIVTFEAVP